MPHHVVRGRADRLAVRLDRACPFTRVFGIHASRLLANASTVFRLRLKQGGTEPAGPEPQPHQWASHRCPVCRDGHGHPLASYLMAGPLGHARARYEPACSACPSHHPWGAWQAKYRQPSAANRDTTERIRQTGRDDRAARAIPGMGIGRGAWCGGQVFCATRPSNTSPLPRSD